MSLTATDLQEIRTVIREELRGLEGQVEALQNDIKEIYFMIAKLQQGSTADKRFSRLSLEEKLLKMNTDLLAAAKQAGITLPRN